MIERAPPPRHGITRAAVIGSIAQLVERLAHIEEVGGSIPSGPTPHLSGGIAHWHGPPSRKRKSATSRHERSTRSPASSRRGAQVRFKGPGCYPGRSAHVRWRKGPNPFLSSTAAWRKTVARRAVNSSGPGSNPGAAATGL